MRLPLLSRVFSTLAIASSLSIALSIGMGVLAPSAADAKQPAEKRESAPPAAPAARAKNGGKTPAKSEGTKGEKSKSEDRKARAQAGAGTQSIGSPNRGRLQGGMRLRPTKHLEIRPYARTWALPELVRLLRRASEDVAKKHRGSVLYVGDLSAKAGGAIDGHNSHQSGRDVDVGFFVSNTKGRPVHMKRFIAFDGSGKAPTDVTWVRFDDARNWAFVEALLKDPKAGVRYIFISNPLRARLLAYAAKKQVPKDVIARAASAMMNPREAETHDDHFHVRVACPESMVPGCVEESSARDNILPIVVASADAGGLAAKHGASRESAPAPGSAGTGTGAGAGAAAGAGTAAGTGTGASTGAPAEVAPPAPPAPAASEPDAPDPH